MLMPLCELPDRDRAARNKQSLNSLYNVVCDIRETSAGMGEKEYPFESI